MGKEKIEKFGGLTEATFREMQYIPMYLYIVFEENGEKKLRIISKYFKRTDDRGFKRTCYANMEKEYAEQVVIPVKDIVAHVDGHHDAYNYMQGLLCNVYDKWDIDMTGKKKRISPTIYNHKLTLADMCKYAAKDLKKFGGNEITGLLQIRYVDNDTPCGTYVDDNNRTDLLTKEEAEQRIENEMKKEFGFAMDHMLHMMLHHTLYGYGRFKIIDGSIDTKEFAESKKKQIEERLRKKIDNFVNELLS